MADLKSSSVIAAVLITTSAMAATADPGSATASVAAAQPLSTYVLPVELKHPFTAYAVGVAPFGSYVAANYVGTSRLEWEPPGDLKWATFNQTLFDVVMVFGGAFLFSLGQGPGMLGVGMLASVPIAHLFYFGPYWGSEAVSFNRKQLSENGFRIEGAGSAR